MKRVFATLWLLVSVGAFAAPVSATVQVKEASLYANPSVVSKFVGKVAGGTVVSVLEEKNGWGRVQVDKATSGWMRTQSYTTQAANLKSTQAGSSQVSNTEVSLAGRGFSEELEADYKRGHPQLDFVTLDRMEQESIDPNELTAFLKDGGLKPREVK